MANLPANLEHRLKEAVRHFWVQRSSQSQKQGGESAKDRGDRAAVTAGKHLDGFRELIAALLEEAGLLRATVYWRKQTELPGWFRAEKNWDLLVVADRRLVAVVELKSQVGPSFGNNFNNRTEEALGNATDLWAAYEEGAFSPSERPWLGYLLLLEDAEKANTPVQVKQPHFDVFPEFRSASYRDRYNQFLTRLLRKRLYDAACFLTSPRKEGLEGRYSEPSTELSFRNFVTSLLGRAVAVALTQPAGLAAPLKVEAGE